MPDIFEQFPGPRASLTLEIELGFVTAISVEGRCLRSSSPLRQDGAARCLLPGSFLLQSDRMEYSAAMASWGRCRAAEVRLASRGKVWSLLL
jgi:hypothetical protein